MIEWKPTGRFVYASIGHLFAYIEDNGGHRYPGHPDYEPPTFQWFIAPDREDKNYRRALEDGNAESLEAAKAAIVVAFRRILDKLTADVEELEQPDE